MSNTANLNKSFPNNDFFEVELAVIERDTAQYRKERLDKLVLELQSKSNLIAEKPTEPPHPQTVKEVTFSTLVYAPQQGAKLGSYEIANKPRVDSNRWIYAYNILRQNNATIQDRYHEEGYEYSYWLYGEEKIYRQKLKEKT